MSAFVAAHAARASPYGVLGFEVVDDVRSDAAEGVVVAVVVVDVDVLSLIHLVVDLGARRLAAFASPRVHSFVVIPVQFPIDGVTVLDLVTPPVGMGVRAVGMSLDADPNSLFMMTVYHA